MSDPPNAIARRPENGTQDRSAAVAMVHVKLKKILGVKKEREREKGGRKGDRDIVGRWELRVQPLERPRR